MSPSAKTIIKVIITGVVWGLIFKMWYKIQLVKKKYDTYEFFQAIEIKE